MATLDVLIWAHANRIVVGFSFFQIPLFGWTNCVLAGHQIVIAALNTVQPSGRQKGANRGQFADEGFERLPCIVCMRFNFSPLCVFKCVFKLSARTVR